MTLKSDPIYDPPDRDSFTSGFRCAARPLMFDTGVPDYPVASHGGTATLLEYEGEIHAVTCSHEFGGFDWQRLIVTPSLGGGPPAAIRSIFDLSHPIHEAIDSDILDLVAIQLAVDSTWFVDKPTRIDACKIAECADGELVCAIGCVAHRSEIGRLSNISQGELHVHVSPRTLSDITLRHGSAYITTDESSSLNGMSGGPVFRISDHAFCGIMVRGGITDDLANVYFVEATDVLEILRASKNPGTMHTYEKRIFATNKK